MVAGRRRPDPPAESVPATGRAGAGARVVGAVLPYAHGFIPEGLPKAVPPADTSERPRPPASSAPANRSRRRLIRYPVQADMKKKREHGPGNVWWVIDPLMLMVVYVVP
jgi:hypothetical protein